MVRGRVGGGGTRGTWTERAHARVESCQSGGGGPALQSSWGGGEQRRCSLSTGTARVVAKVFVRQCRTGRGSSAVEGVVVVVVQVVVMGGLLGDFYTAAGRVQVNDGSAS